MSLLSAAKSYLQVRPIGIRNAVRLYSTHGISALVGILVPGRFRSVGYLIPGRSKLTVRL